MASGRWIRDEKANEMGQPLATLTLKLRCLSVILLLIVRGEVSDRAQYRTRLFVTAGWTEQEREADWSWIRYTAAPQFSKEVTEFGSEKGMKAGSMSRVRV